MVAGEEHQPGEEQGDRQWRGGPSGSPQAYGPLFTKEQLDYLQRWDKPGGLVNLGKAKEEPELQLRDFIGHQMGTVHSKTQGKGTRTTSSRKSRRRTTSSRRPRARGRPM